MVPVSHRKGSACSRFRQTIILMLCYQSIDGIKVGKADKLVGEDKSYAT